MKKKQNSLKFRLKIALLCLIAICYSCETSEKTAPESNSNEVFQIDQSKMDIVYEYASIYNDELEKYINENEVEDITTTVFSTELNNAINSRIASSVKLRSANIGSTSNVESSSDTIDINPYYDELTVIIEGIDLDIENNTKEDYLAAFQLATEEYIESIKTRANLASSEKQLIIESVVFKTSIIQTTIFYADEFTAEDNISMRKRCGWFCKNKKKVDCIWKTGIASITCGISVAAILTGQVAGGIAVAPSCIYFAADAINCWRNI